MALKIAGNHIRFPITKELQKCADGVSACGVTLSWLGGEC